MSMETSLYLRSMKVLSDWEIHSEISLNSFRLRLKRKSPLPLPDDEDEDALKGLGGGGGPCDKTMARAGATLTPPMTWD